jgi:anthranilate phosphoribosyltransferase
MDTFKPFIAKVATGASLTASEARDAFDTILSGEVTPAQSAGFLMALRVRGETVAEISGAVSALRSRAVRVSAPADAIDIVGTGGDNSGSYNVSTLASIIVASCGVPVAKHGNRAASSLSGTADVLGALGVKVGIDPAGVERCLALAGLGFMFAPAHHASMRHVAPVRVELGTRTIFNLIGPMSNPAGVTRQLLGTFAESWLLPMVEVLQALGDGLPGKPWFLPTTRGYRAMNHARLGDTTRAIAELEACIAELEALEGAESARATRFRDVLKPENYKRFRWRFFRVHFQYLMANERRATYDYFMMICGPRLLAEVAASPPPAGD